jgi:hypothetical protein
MRHRLKIKRRLIADHRPADAIVIRLCHDLQKARRALRRPGKQQDARRFERMAFGYLMEYLTTLDCSDPDV